MVCEGAENVPRSIPKAMVFSSFLENSRYLCTAFQDRDVRNVVFPDELRVHCFYRILAFYIQPSSEPDICSVGELGGWCACDLLWRRSLLGRS